MEEAAVLFEEANQHEHKAFLMHLLTKMNTVEYSIKVTVLLHQFDCNGTIWEFLFAIESNRSVMKKKTFYFGCLHRSWLLIFMFHVLERKGTASFWPTYIIAVPNFWHKKPVLLHGYFASRSSTSQLCDNTVSALRSRIPDKLVGWGF